MKKTFLLILILSELIISCNVKKNEVIDYNNISTDTNNENKHSKIPLTSIEKNELASILDDSGFAIDTTKNKINFQIIKLREKLKLIDKLIKAYPILRDTLAPYGWEYGPKYFILRHKQNLIRYDSIKNLLVINKSKLSTNQLFVNNLFYQNKDTSLITIEKAIFPIFNYIQSSTGIYGNDGYLNVADKKLWKNLRTNDTKKEKYALYEDEFDLNSNVIDSIYPKGKQVFLFTNKKKYISKVKSFGKYTDVCLSYFFYECNVNNEYKNTEYFLFGSNFNLDLVYYENKTLDMFINIGDDGIFYDCPNSFNSQKIFAKLKGFNNLYFTYAIESNSKIDKTYTPLRRLVYIKDKVILNIWTESIDLFGCSCL